MLNYDNAILPIASQSDAINKHCALIASECYVNGMSVICAPSAEKTCRRKPSWNNLSVMQAPSPLPYCPLYTASNCKAAYYSITMSTCNVSRALTNTIRQIGRSRPRPLQVNPKRAASSKHPRGFVPPTAEDLTELRERVQEFTSEIFDSTS